ncbi:MAG TPA: hypothetical protein VGE74_31110 [Gemmata sp.]
MTATDRDHLRILAICHYILGGLSFLFGFLPFFHLVIGIVIVGGGVQPAPGNNGPPPELMGWLFIGFASLAIAFSWALAAALVTAGRCLSQRRSRTFCLIVAGVSCLNQPFGLILGVFTILVLTRPRVRRAFEPERSAPARDEPAEFDRYHHE